MKGLQTVQGLLPPEELGVTLAHEHLAMDLSTVRGETDSVFRDPGEVCEELEVAVRQGVRSVVEVTCCDMGRDVMALREISFRTGLNILCSTGYYLDEYHPADMRKMSVESLRDFFVKEVTEGIGDTGIRAAVIGEMGCGNDGPTESEQKALAAAGQAQKLSGAPVAVHCHLGQHAKTVLDILQKNGANPSKICLGHMDLCPRAEEVIAALQSGCYIACDTIGKNSYRTNRQRAELVSILVKEGFGNRVVLSQDISRRSYYAKTGGLGYGYLFDAFLPELRGLGVSEDQIRQLLTANAAGWLLVA